MEHENEKSISSNLLLGDVYLPILNIFCSNDKINRGWMAKPFISNGKTISTNGWVLFAVPQFGEYEDKSEKIKGIYPIEHNKNIKYPLENFKSVISKMPLIDCFDEQEIKCDACGGEGEVIYEFDYGRKNYEIEHECPICEGEGVSTKRSDKPNGKKEIDNSKFIKIGNCTFNVNRIEELVFAASKLNVDFVELVNQTTSNRPCLFKIADAEMLMMPTTPNDDAMIVFTIA